MKSRVFKVQRQKMSGHFPLQGYTPGQLKAIFTQPGFADPSQYGREHWAALVALYSGMRASELAALSSHDVRQVEGVWVFDVPPAKYADRRLVPLHQRLIELNFPRFVESRKDAQSLFGWSDGRAVIRAFAKIYRSAVGEPDAGDSYGRFRHTLITELGHTPVTGLFTGHQLSGADRESLDVPLGERLRIMSRTLDCADFAV